jgi:hypothetical protein
MDGEHDMHPASEDDEDHLQEEDKSEEEEEMDESLQPHPDDQGYYEQQGDYGSSEGVSAEAFQQEISNMVRALRNTL